MRGIPDTIARLSRMQAMKAHSPKGRAEDTVLVPFERFGPNPGALKAWCHVPDGLGAGAPLVVVLHGCTQDAAGYDTHSGWSHLADQAGFALLYPEQQRANNPNLCFNWFQPADARRGSGEALSIRQMIEGMVAVHGLDRDRVFITGLSAGGAMAATMLACYPDVLAGGAIVAGLAHGIAATVPEAFDRMRGHGIPSTAALQALLRAASDHKGRWPTLSIWQGMADQTVAPSNAEALLKQWKGVHGVDGAPMQTTTSGPRTRQLWSDAAGKPLIEVNWIAGMGHGTPVGAGLGSAGPYMLDVGVSSTHEIAGFWGLVSETDSRRHAAAANTRRPTGRTAGAQPSAQADESPEDASGVRRTIEDALKAAGLMR